ncbi:hypothetical protein WJX74_002566 [Apatococcus lobatus]|uniref:HYDIN/VesB/CFA65-like Ig-like domain-containing protein n=1 Tax=Apatococcus lobatus TaxID=904363 RepID=A0AAW1RI82_9CHLO
MLGESDMSYCVACSFDDTDFLQVGCQPTMLAKGQHLDIPITFTPHRAQKYEATVALRVLAGMYTHQVAISGEAVPLKLELMDAKQRHISLGAVVLGCKVQRKTQIVNRSKIAAEVSFGGCSAALEQQGVELHPHDLTLLPRGIAELTFTYRPPQRLEPFKREVIAQAAGFLVPLLTVSGSCVAADVALSSKHLAFGTVTFGAQAHKQVLLQNSGQVPVTYAWDVKALKPNFSIKPAGGTAAPGQSVQLHITCHPSKLSSELRAHKVRCGVAGSSDLLLSLTAACAEAQPEPGALSFQAAVGSSDTRLVTLPNVDGVADWHIRPVIRNSQWSGPDMVVVPAGTEASYELTYRPITQSTQEKPHQGQVFFPKQDGSALLHRLEGVASEPVPSGNIIVQVAARVQHADTIRVENWAPASQRFRAIPALDSAPPATSFTGPDIIAVPAHGSTTWAYKFSAKAEGTATGRVTFKNEATGEYRLWNITFKVGRPITPDAVTISSPARQSAVHTINVDNPLKQDVTIAVAADKEGDLTFPASLLVPASGSAGLRVSFRPLLVGSARATLRLSSKELGLEEHVLQLVGTAGRPERALNFETALGSNETQTVTLTHYAKQKADYKCSLAEQRIVGLECKPATLSAPTASLQGLPLSLDIVYEPIALTDTMTDVITIASPVGGIYEVPVTARCTAPRPQGPADIIKGAGSITFTNVFLKQATFSIAVDNPAFVVKASETIAAKKSVQVTIGVTKEAAGQILLGRLTITCPAETPAVWTFYLRTVS